VTMEKELLKTVFHPRHRDLEAKLVPFAGWEMPLNYPSGIIAEHLATRREAGLFDVSHMGRFIFRGRGALAFLQHVLSNNAAALDVGRSQYTIVPNDTGGAVDDAYLYRFFDDEYLLVVNAANRKKDWDHFKSRRRQFADFEMADVTDDLAMLALQGPESKKILTSLVGEENLPEPMRNYLAVADFRGTDLLVSRTGYTGEPLCFELFVKRDRALDLWDALVEAGGRPVGLGARDTLRLEAALPLYGNEFGTDPEGKEIPVYACLLASIAVSFSPLKGEFVGKAPLRKQFEAHKRYKLGDFSDTADLPRRIRPVAVSGKGIARAGNKVFRSGKLVGYVTSGTMVPYWKWEGVGLLSRMTDERGMRSICLALIDSEIEDLSELEIEIRGRKTQAVPVPYHLRVEAPPYARPILYDRLFKEKEKPAVPRGAKEKVLGLVRKSIENTRWRQRETINLIPSEQTPSALVRLLSVTDPAGRYAEHKEMKAFEETDIFYYQGTKFIAEVEELLEEELRSYLGCREIETRIISGQMANAAFFSAMVDYLNSGDRKSEQRRIRQVLNHHIVKGGHLSAQPMGALRDFVRRDPRTERPAVVNFPMRRDNPFDVDLKTTKELIAEYRPELIIFGRSMTIHKEPVRPVCEFLKEEGLDRCVVMYDMAHVLGLAGPYFQEPFKEGAQIVTGSTHKTFFGTQRGIIASDFEREDLRYPLWEAVRRRTFPGSVSNHHLGTQLGLLLAAYEMNHFRDEYQRKVIENAKAFARAFHELGMEVAGDPGMSFTETHQVILHVGYLKGPEAAERLEENNIIVNFQAGPEEESFSASGYLRMGVAEMTRFGMEKEDFAFLAELIRDVVEKGMNVKEKVVQFRNKFLAMRYCFSDEDISRVLGELRDLLS